MFTFAVQPRQVRSVRRHAAGVGGTALIHLALIWLFTSSVSTTRIPEPTFEVTIVTEVAPHQPDIRPPRPTLRAPRFSLSLPHVEVLPDALVPLTAAPVDAPGDERGPDGAVAYAGAAIDQNYFLILIRHLQRYIVYPPLAQKQGLQGAVDIRLTITREGRVLSTRIERSSGVTALDNEGVALMTRAEPLPRPPANMRGSPLILVIPVTFEIAARAASR